MPPSPDLAPLTHGVSGAPDLAGRVALVTGAARGIGRAIAEVLAEAGAAVALVDLLPAEATAAAIRGAGGEALVLPGDVAARADAEAAVGRTVAELGRLDILVNNAGVVERSTLETLDDATFQREIDVILRGTYLFTQAAYAVMRRQGGGKIVNVSSVSAKQGGAVSRGDEAQGRSGPAYAAAKGGVIAFTKWVAKDAGRHGVCVNAVCPGPVTSEMTRGAEYDLSGLPLGRMGQPRDIAQAVLFLASGMSNFVTGQSLNVDGGLLME